MSGGHFSYDDAYLDYIAEQLEQDIKYNDAPWNNPVVVDGEEHHGSQLEPKTLHFLQDAAQQLRQLRRVLREYDLAVSGDTCEKTFQERVGIK